MSRVQFWSWSQSFDVFGLVSIVVTATFCSHLKVLLMVTYDYQDPDNHQCQPVGVMCGSWNDYQVCWDRFWVIVDI